MSAMRIASKVKAIQGKLLKLANEFLKESNIHKVNLKTILVQQPYARKRSFVK